MLQLRRALGCGPRGLLRAHASPPTLPARPLAALSSSFSSASASASASASPARAPASLLDLSSIRDNPGARKRTRRKGRGVGSGHGLARSAGEGSKGQKSHEGGAVSAGFEGGQAPLWRRTPKIGVAMPRMLRAEPEPLNLGKLQLWIDSGRIDAAAKITMRTLCDARLVPHIRHGVKLLARGKERFAAKVDIEVSQVSAEAVRTVEARGGSVVSVYYTQLALRSVLRPEKFDFPIKSPRPAPNKIGYYLNYRNRGYLSSRLQLQQLEQALAAGAGSEAAARRMPVYVGGGPVENATDDLNLGLLVEASAAAQGPAEALAQASVASAASLK